MLHVISAGCWRLAPGPQRDLKIVGMHCVEPAIVAAVGIRKAGEEFPLRAAPGALAGAQRPEHQLRDIGRQQPEALLAVAPRLLNPVPFGAVSKDLHETAAVAQTLQYAGAPKERSGLADVPSF